MADTSNHFFIYNESTMPVMLDRTMTGGRFLVAILQPGETYDYTYTGTLSYFRGIGFGADDNGDSSSLTDRLQVAYNTVQSTLEETRKLTPVKLYRTTYNVDLSTDSPSYSNVIKGLSYTSKDSTPTFWGTRDFDRYFIISDYGSSAPQPTYSKVTTNLKNCTITSVKDSDGTTLTQDTIEVGKSITMELTPNDGYKWSSNPNVGDGISTIATGSYSDETGVATISFTSTSSIYVNGSCEEIPQTVTYAKVATNLDHCTVNEITDSKGNALTLDTIPVGESVTIVLKLEANYKWNTRPTITDGISTIATANYPTQSVLDNAEFSNFTAVDNFTIIGTAVLDVIPITDTLTYCTEEHTPTDLLQGGTLNVTFTASNGYYFKDAPTIRYDIALGSQYVDCTISDDGLTATGTLDTSTVSGRISNISLSGVGTLLPSIPTVTNSLIKVYKMTQDALTELATKRWNVTTSDGVQTIDLAYYITSLKKFYFNVKTSLDTTLTLYTYDTGIQASIVAGDTVDLDCGEITIESTNDNNNDYSNTTVQIMLPFIGMTTIDSFVVGKTLHLVYSVSTITGDCVAKIYVNDYIMYEYSGNTSEDIPYILNNIQWQLQGSVSFNSTSLYGLTPFVIVEYHDNYNDNNSLVLSDNKRCRLDSLTGLNYVTDVNIDDMTIDERTRQLIISTLESGVIF